MHLPAGVYNARFTKPALLGKHLINPGTCNTCRLTGFFLSVQTKYEYEGLDPFESKPTCTFKTTRFIKALCHRQKPEEGVKK